MSGYSVGPPTFNTVAPGNCVFNEDWTACPLVSKATINHDTRVFTFGLADKEKSLGLSTCACLLVQGGKDAEGNPVVRPYTPVSTNVLKGAFELMVKVYPGGVMSGHMDQMQVGETLNFKHIGPNVKLQYPFGKKKMGMFVGGTGITPMIQALHAVLGNTSDETEVTMLYGSRTEKDVLAKETLDEWVGANPRLKVIHVLSHEAEGSEWKGERGFINKDIIAKYMPGPAEDVKLVVCGPPPMYAALCGARDAKELTGTLADMGYTAEQVYKF